MILRGCEDFFSGKDLTMGFPVARCFLLFSAVRKMKCVWFVFVFGFGVKVSMCYPNPGCVNLAHGLFDHIMEKYR